MTDLTNAAESRNVDWLTGNSTTAPTLPLKVALVTANGSESAAGTEVTGGSYARQSVSFGAASSGATSNSGVVRFEGMPTCTVVGIEIWDSAGTPFRWFYKSITSRSFTAGDVAEFAIGDIDITAD